MNASLKSYALSFQNCHFRKIPQNQKPFRASCDITHDALEHFPTKWIPVHRRKCDQTKKRAFSDEADTGSSQKMDQTRKLER